MNKIYLKFDSQDDFEQIDYISLYSKSNKRYFKDFLKSTMVGSTRAIYRRVPDKKIINNKLIFESIFTISICEYFNKGFRALIYSADGPKKREFDKDEFWINTFSKFINPKQSYICALNKIMDAIKEILKSIDYKSIDISSIEKIEESLTLQLNEILDNSIFNDIFDHLSHPCDGQDIKFCDPNINMFFIK